MNPDRHAEDGASAVEYGLLISGIAALVVLVIVLFGGYVGGLFSDTCDTVDAERVTAGAASQQCE
jgi:pilus assembly protein Flp/PilA